MRLFPSLTSRHAHDLLLSASDMARTLGANVSIAVVDRAGELLAFSRMDGARSFTVELAVEKARAAARLASPTAMLAAAGIRSRAGNIFAAGGIPISYKGECAGGIGVSGALPELDVRIAEQAANMLTTALAVV